MYTYRAKVTRVVDGDTVDVNVDLGFGTFSKQRFRLAEIDAPETFRRKKDSEEYKAGMKSKNWLEEKVKDQNLIVKTEKDKKGAYGRYIVHIFLEGEEKSLNQQMLELGLAKKYQK